MEFVGLIIDLLPCLSGPLTRHASYLFKARANVNKMEKELAKLRACHGDFQKVKEDATRKREQVTGELALWEENVVSVEEEASATKKSYQNRGCLLFGDCSFSCCLVYKYGKNAARLHDEMVKLIREWKDSRTLTTAQRPEAIPALPIESTLVGLDPYVEKVRSLLIDESVGVIGIHGMGGIGKTTLLKKVHNSLLEGDKMGFEYLIWVVVSKEFQLEKLQAQVASSLGLVLNGEDSPPKRASFISDYLKDKSFLLLLDDVWKWLDLLELGIPDTRCSSSNATAPNVKQKVIVTTRFREVCASMGASNATIKVEPLEKHEARILFKRTLGNNNNVESDSELHGLIDEVADECGGLPLALTVIARAMASKTNIEEWKTAIRYLRRSQLNEIVDDNLDMLRRLKFSYDSLRSDVLRSCFLYCALWPEDHDISDLELVEFLISNEVIKDFDDTVEAYDIGHCLVEDLKGACLLEVGGKDFHVKMHDVMRDLALWIASDCGADRNKWLVKPGIGLVEAPLDARKWEKASVVSLMRNEIVELPSIPCESPLSILLLNSNEPLRKIHPGFFHYLHALTYLDLSQTDISELPESIVMLRRLRCLNLQETDNLETLPSKMISSFQELQVLNLFLSGACRTMDSLIMGELERLPRGLLGLGIDVYSVEAFNRLSKLSRFFVWHLKVAVSQGLTALRLKPHTWRSLRTMVLHGCDEVEVLEFRHDADADISDVCPAAHVEIMGLSCLKEILWGPGVAPSMFFSRLRFLVISDCYQLRSVGWVAWLPVLVFLRVSGCHELECLVEDGEEDGVAFPRLKRLELKDLPEMYQISSPDVARRGFLALENTVVERCPKLTESERPPTKLRGNWSDDQVWEYYCFELMGSPPSLVASA